MDETACKDWERAAVRDARERLRPYLEGFPEVLSALEDDRAIDEYHADRSARADWRPQGPRSLLYSLTRHVEQLADAFGPAVADEIKALRGGFGRGAALPETWETTPRAWRLSRL
jgi:hypothetical protein